MKPALLKISIQHNVPYVEVARIADSVEHDGRIFYPEVDGLSEEMMELIKAVHLAVTIDQEQRGLIRKGERSVVVPRESRING